jgi:hypothetical protein
MVDTTCKMEAAILRAVSLVKGALSSSWLFMWQVSPTWIVLPTLLLGQRGLER